MGKRIVQVSVDDLDGSESPQVRSVEFSLDNVGYCLDLSPQNVDRLRDALEPFIATATGLGNVSDRRFTSSQVREWALAQGQAVSSRGRLSSELIESYRQAHGLS